MLENIENYRFTLDYIASKINVQKSELHIQNCQINGFL
jgi:hypothetical protein